MSASRTAIATPAARGCVNRCSSLQYFWLLLLAVLFVAPARLSAAVSITISPSAVNLPAAGTQQFTAIVTGASNTSVVWTIQEGSSGGSVTNSGLYSAPGVVGTYHVVATSDADNTQSGTATVVVPGFITSGLVNVGSSCDTATLLPSGKVLYTGTGLPTNGAPATDFAELYDPAIDRSILTGNMTIPRCQHTATLLLNGKVLITGGQTIGTQTPTAELYDPLSGTFIATGSMSVPRIGHTATLLPSGMVLITGGLNCTSGCVYLNAAELYDPVAGTFSRTGNLGAGRSVHTATLLANGKVLIAGGTSDGTNPIANAELYDSATGFFTQTGAMINPRLDFTATLLPSGKVLLAGGLVGSVLSSAAEI
jgi:hypothetical protein